MHKCSDDEFSRFYPPADEATEKKVKMMQAGGHLYCFDWKETNFDLFGSEASGLDFAAMDPTLIPCASEVTLHDGSIVGGEDECVWEKEEVMKKMGSAFNFMTYFNVEEFRKD